jgi:hypothetical protein
VVTPSADTPGAVERSLQRLTLLTVHKNGDSVGAEGCERGMAGGAIYDIGSLVQKH